MSHLLARREDPYAGADMANARRLGAFVWLLTAAACAAVMPLAPPTDVLGAAGWAVAGAVLAGFCLIAVAFRRGEGWITWNLMYVVSYLSLAMIVLLDWLAGGDQPPYEVFLVIPVIYSAAIHPPRRVLAFLVAVVAVVALPLLLNGWSREAAASAVALLIISLGLGALGLLLMERVRAQRIGLRSEGEEARQQARVDSLTGLGNRRAFDEALETEVARSRRTSLPLSLVVVDLDDFKEINDRYGHLEGDRCLNEVAGVLAHSSRRPDSCFRWGGDEFTLLLTGTDEDGAAQAGERLAEAIRRRVRRPGGGSITIRFGMAQLDREMSGDDLVERADLALLGSKSANSEAELQ